MGTDLHIAQDELYLNLLMITSQNGNLMMVTFVFKQKPKNDLHYIFSE